MKKYGILVSLLFMVVYYSHAQRNISIKLKENGIKEIHEFGIRDNSEKKLRSISYIDSLGREYKHIQYDIFDSSSSLKTLFTRYNEFDSLGRLVRAVMHRDTIKSSYTYQYVKTKKNTTIYLEIDSTEYGIYNSKVINIFHGKTVIFKRYRTQAIKAEEDTTNILWRDPNPTKSSFRTTSIQTSRKSKNKIKWKSTSYSFAHYGENKENSIRKSWGEDSLNDDGQVVKMISDSKTQKKGIMKNEKHIQDDLHSEIIYEYNDKKLLAKRTNMRDNSVVVYEYK